MHKLAGNCDFSSCPRISIFLPVVKNAANISELLVMPLVALQQPVEGVVHLGAVAQEAQQVGPVAVLVKVLAAAQDVVVARISHFVTFCDNLIKCDRHRRSLNFCLFLSTNYFTKVPESLRRLFVFSGSVRRKIIYFSGTETSQLIICFSFNRSWLCPSFRDG